MNLEKPFVMTEEYINELIVGDYPQFGPMHVYSDLWLVADGDKLPGTFYDEINVAGLKNLSDYLVYHAKKYNQTLPASFSLELRAKIAQIDAMFIPFKALIDRRAPLKELYQETMKFLRVFGDEQRYNSIPQFEE